MRRATWILTAVMLVLGGVGAAWAEEKGGEPGASRKEGREKAARDSIPSFSVFDLDGDGIVSREELEAAFKKLDTNGDGILTADEIQAGLSGSKKGDGEAGKRNESEKKVDVKREGDRERKPEVKRGGEGDREGGRDGEGKKVEIMRGEGEKKIDVKREGDREKKPEVKRGGEGDREGEGGRKVEEKKRGEGDREKEKGGAAMDEDGELGKDR